MEALTSTASVTLPREPDSHVEVSMQQSMLLSDSLMDLKNLRKQLYSAADYFELSYINDDQKHIIVNTLQDYAIKALVNTVDHLGFASYKVDDLLDEKVDEVSGTELRVSCIEQRLKTYEESIGHQGLSQQSLVINTPKYHKRYILPVGGTMNCANHLKLHHQGCSLDDEDHWHQFRHGSVLAFNSVRVTIFFCNLCCLSNSSAKPDCILTAVRGTIRETPASAVRKGCSPSPSPRLSQQHGSFSFSGTSPREELEKRTVSPHRFPLLRTGPLVGWQSTPRKSRPTTPNPSRPNTPNLSMGQQFLSEHRKSASMWLHAERESPKNTEHNPSRSKRLLKVLLSRRKSKKDDMLYNYLDEY